MDDNTVDDNIHWPAWPRSGNGYVEVRVYGCTESAYQEKMS